MEKQDGSEKDQKLTVRLAELAKLLSLSERAVWALADSGDLPSFKLGSARLFSMDAVREWIQSKSEGQNE